MNRTRSGQSLVEFALMLPLVAFFMAAAFQWLLLFFTYLSVLNVTRDAARWVSVHPHNADTTTYAAITSRLPPNLQAAKMPMVQCPSSGVPSSAVGLQICPPCTSVDGNTGCPNRSSANNDRISVTIRYDASSLIFFPTTFGIAPWFVVGLPSNLPGYTLYMLAETADPNS